MDLKHLRNIEDLKAFVAGSKRFTIKAKTIEDRYEIIEDLVHRFNYWRLKRKDKHIVLAALKLFTAYILVK